MRSAITDTGQIQFTTDNEIFQCGTELIGADSGQNEFTTDNGICQPSADWVNQDRLFKSSLQGIMRSASTVETGSFMVKINSPAPLGSFQKEAIKKR